MCSADSDVIFPVSTRASCEYDAISLETAVRGDTVERMAMTTGSLGATTIN
jgi:hypothetical protein